MADRQRVCTQEVIKYFSIRFLFLFAIFLRFRTFWEYMEQDILKLEFLKHAIQTFILKGLWFELYCMSEIHRYRVDGLVKIFPERKPGLNIIFDLMRSGEKIRLIEFLFSDVAKRLIQLNFFLFWWGMGVQTLPILYFFFLIFTLIPVLYLVLPCSLSIMNK